MKTILLAGCLVFAMAMQAEVYTPKSRPVIPELMLSDGRTLKDAKILSDTAYTVSVASGGRIVPVEKKLLPAEQLALWPVDEVRGEKEKAKLRAAEQVAAAKVEAFQKKQEAQIEKNKQVAVALKEEQAAKNAAYAAKTEAEHAAREEKFYRQHAAKQASRNGLLIEGAVSSYGNLYVLITNASDGQLKFDWQALRVTPLTYTGEHMLAGPIVLSHHTEDLWIKPWHSRVFRLKLTSQMEMKSIRWEDRKEIYPVKQLYRQENSWDMRDEYRLERISEPPSDSVVEKILLRATQPFVQAPLRKKT